MADMVDKRLYEELAQKDPAELILAPFCSYDEVEKRYTVTAWSDEYLVYPESAKIEIIGEVSRPHDYFFVFLLNYLLSDKKVRPHGEWISVKDLPGGVTFFRGPHEIPTNIISKNFENDLPRLQQTCEMLGGTRLNLADLSYSFTIVAAIQTALLYWQGDEDFPAEANILIDKSILKMPLDIVYALLCDVCFRIGKAS